MRISHNSIDMRCRFPTMYKSTAGEAMSKRVRRAFRRLEFSRTIGKLTIRSVRVLRSAMRTEVREFVDPRGRRCRRHEQFKHCRT